MKKFASIALMAGLGLASTGCDIVLGMFGMGGGPDMAKMMADQADYNIPVALHSRAAEGQWAEWEGAGGTTTWWGVTGTKGDYMVVENRMGDLTYIYVVDAEGNKQESWVANWKKDAEEVQEAHERKLQDPPEAQPGDAPETTEGTETVTAAGKDWDCKWIALEVMGKEAKTWTCEDGWFTKLIKSTYGGDTTSMLKEIGDGATMGFKWPEAAE